MSSKIPRSSSKFALDDIDNLLSRGMTVKPKIPDPVIVKPRIPTTRSKTLARKRKTFNVDLEIFEGVDLVETEKKVKSLIILGLEKMVADHEVAEGRAKVAEEMVEDVKKITTARSKAMDQDRQEIFNLKKELEDLKISYQQEIAATIEDTKHSAASSVLQSRIKMAEEASAEGFDVKSWDLGKWRMILAGLISDKAETSKVGEDASGDDAGDKDAGGAIPQGDKGIDA